MTITNKLEKYNRLGIPTKSKKPYPKQRFITGYEGVKDAEFCQELEEVSMELLDRILFKLFDKKCFSEKLEHDIWKNECDKWELEHNVKIDRNLVYCKIVLSETQKY